MPLTWVLAQASSQFTPSGHSLKNINTAPTSRDVLRTHGVVNSTCSRQGSEYARGQLLPAALQRLRTTSIRLTQLRVRSCSDQLAVSSALGSAPVIWQ